MTSPVLITGSRGQLGDAIRRRIDRFPAYTFTLTDIDELDLCDKKAVLDFIRRGRYAYIINCAAYTAVDRAESDAERCMRINRDAVGHLATAAREVSARIIHISTDYVFSGDATSPYREDGLLEPKGAYGRTKAAGEWAVRCNTDDYLIVRTAWLYGAGGKCFPKTMRDLSQTHETLSVVTDEVGQPTWTVDLADLIVRLVDAEAPTGIYHGTSSGKTNWHGFTREIVASIGKDPDMVKETTAAAFKRPAPRPHYSVLGHDALERIGVEPIGDWKERWLAAKDVVLG